MGLIFTDQVNIATKVSVFKNDFRRPQHQYEHVVRLVQPISLTLPDLVYQNI